MLLDRMSVSLHNRMVSAGVKNTPSAPVIKYALDIIFNTTSASTMALLIGLVTGKFGETAFVLVAFIAIRYLTGGYHLKSSILCALTSTAVLVTIPNVPLNETWTYVLTGAALVVTLIFAPSNYDKYARMPEKYYPLLKLIASVTVASNFLIGSELLAITYIVQAALMPFGGGEDE